MTLFVALLLVIIATLMPAQWIALLRQRWWWFTYPLDYIEGLQSSINVVHALLFLLLGMATRLSLPRWHFGGIAMAFLCLGALTELAQLLAPGRHARFSDVVVDVVAGVLGWASMRVLVR